MLVFNHPDPLCRYDLQKRNEISKRPKDQRQKNHQKNYQKNHQTNHPKDHDRFEDHFEGLCEEQSNAIIIQANLKYVYQSEHEHSEKLCVTSSLTCPKQVDFSKNRHNIISTKQFTFQRCGGVKVHHAPSSKSARGNNSQNKTCPIKTRPKHENGKVNINSTRISAAKCFSKHNNVKRSYYLHEIQKTKHKFFNRCFGRIWQKKQKQKQRLNQEQTQHKEPDNEQHNEQYNQQRCSGCSFSGVRVRTPFYSVPDGHNPRHTKDVPSGSQSLHAKTAFYKHFLTRSSTKKKWKSWKKIHKRSIRDKIKDLFDCGPNFAYDQDHKKHKNTFFSNTNNNKLNGILKLGTLNCKGFGKEDDFAQTTNYLKTNNIDVLVITETQNNTNQVLVKEGYHFFFSSDVSQTTREQTLKNIEETRTLHKGQVRKGLVKGLGKGETIKSRYGLNQHIENAGICIAIRNKLIPYLILVEHCSGRHMLAKFHKQQRDLVILGVYAPHALREVELKNDFYDTLDNLYNKHKQKEMIILGDFNARIYHRDEEDPNVFGDHFLQYSETTLQNMALGSKENRSLFLDFASKHNLNLVNTFFPNPIEKLATFREVGTKYDDHIQLHKHNTVDYILVHKDKLHKFDDVHTDTVHHVVNTDHYPLIAKYRISLDVINNNEQTIAPEYFKPSDEQFTCYNDFIGNKINGQDINWHELQNILKEAADTCLTRKPPDMRNKILSGATWALIQQRNLLVAEKRLHDQILDLNKQIRKSVAKDKKDNYINKFNYNQPDTYRKKAWKTVKHMKSDFKPTSFQITDDVTGETVPYNKRAEHIANYLAKQQWGLQNPDDTYQVYLNNAHNGETNLINQEFDIIELNHVIKHLKNNKSPGPDGIRTETFKWLNNASRHSLLKIINKYWKNQTSEAEEEYTKIFEARVVLLYKKGDPKKTENYRPISLLNTFYKILMSLIQKRLAFHYDVLIGEKQFGFRAKRSTAQATSIIRRIQDYCEQTKKPVSFLFLDWEKAFDKIFHHKMFETLETLGIDIQTLNRLSHFYSCANFFTVDRFNSSSKMKQLRGIRQGCPLSPYLFVLTLAQLDKDIHRNLAAQVVRERVPNLKTDGIYYADDTVLFSQDNNTLLEILHNIQVVTHSCGLALNQDKCQLIHMYSDGDLNFLNNDLVPVTDSTKYLGNNINNKFDVDKEIGIKLRECNYTWYKLDLFWKHNNNDRDKRWKLIVLDSVIRAKLLYGLESLQLTDAKLKKLDTFQYRAIRKILGVPSTYIDRTFSNVKLLQIANDIIKNCSKHKYTELKPFSVYWKNQKQKLLGHLIREPNHSITRHVILQDNSATEHDWGKRRIGRPRQSWIKTTKREIFCKLHPGSTYTENQQSDNIIFHDAMNRRF
jgi:hypothetical protein